MIVSEAKLRKIIKHYLSEDFEVDRINAKLSSDRSADCEITTDTTFPLNSNKTAIVVPPSARAIFDKLKVDLKNKLEAKGYTGEVRGRMIRALSDAAVDGGNPARIAGSKHGLGLAVDLKLDYPAIHKSDKHTRSKAGNKLFADDPVFTKIMYSFHGGKLQWGGTWGKDDDPANGVIKGYGLDEYHHFEISDAYMSNILTTDGYDEHIKALGFTLEDMKDNEKRASMYLKLTGEECVNPEDVDAVADTGTSTGDGLTSDSDDGSDTESTDRVAYNEDSCLEAGGTFDASSGVCTIEIDSGMDSDGDGEPDFDIITTKFHKKDNPDEYYTT